MPGEPIVSRPYRPGEKCCEKCAFGSGEHALWCQERSAEIVPAKIQDGAVTFVKTEHWRL